MTGWTVLLRLALRRDRVLIPAWIAVFVVVAGGSAAATGSLYADPAALAAAGHAVNATPALLAMYGPVYDVTSLGAVGLMKLNAFGAALVGLLGLLIAIRHTRADEEVGRTELAAAGAVGRHAALAAGVATAGLTVTGVGLLSALALAAGGLDLVGSLTLGAAWAVCGLVFTGVGATTAQLTTSARAARGGAVALLVGAYVVRATADTSGPVWLTWLSPVGWSQQTRAYADNRWWPLLVALLATGAVTGTAVALESRRDLGAGLVADQPGPAGGGPHGPLGLAWRLHRMALLGWAVGYAVLGLLLGSIAGSVSGFLEGDAAAMIRALGGTERLVDAFLAAELDITAFVAAGFALGIIARLATEEAQGRTEAVLATPTGRVRWALSHFAVALAGAALLVVVLGAGAGLSRALDTGEPGELATVVGASLVRIPAVWTMAALGLLLYAVAARAAVLGWAALVAVVVLGEFGLLLRLPAWMQDLSPYAHVPPLPGGELTFPPLLALLGVTAALTVAACAAYRSRDVTSG